MTYTANIPQSGDDPSQSQPLILANFQQLNSQYGTAGDHVEWTASSANGKHKKVTWINQSGSVPNAGLNELVAYGITQSGITMPYYKRDNLATVWPLSPIKAYANFTSVALAGTNNIAPTSSFNIDNPIVQTNPGLNTLVFTFTMTNACLTLNYGIFFILNRSGQVSFTYNRVSTQVFTLTSITANPVAFGANEFSVFVLEP